METNITSYSSYKLIIADDHHIVVSGLVSLLKNEEDISIVGTSYSGKELLELVSQTDADTILLDLNMPGLNHLYLIEQLLILPRKLKIIAYTAYNDARLVKSVIENGIHGYLCKSGSELEISEAIRAVHEDKIYIGKTVYHVSENQPLTQADAFLKEIELTPREIEVVKLVANGLTNKKIAKELFLSKHTVETHRKNIMQKLQLQSTAELVKFAVKQGLVD